MLKHIINTFFTRSFVAVILLLNLVITSRYLGSAVLGEVSLLILNIAIIHTIAEIYSGSALVHFIPTSSLKKIYRTGLVWIITCTALINFIFYLFQIGVSDYWPHVFVISFISILHAFHNVILLAREKIRTYNFLILFQPASLLAFLCLNIFVLEMDTVYASIIAMYLSYAISVLISGFNVIQTVDRCVNTEQFRLKDIFANGLINQLGNLAHILSNRYNYYIISGIGVALVGVYASATSLIESVWIISASVSPIILTHIANQKDVANNSRVTFLLSKLCFMLSALLVLIIYFVPNSFFTSLLGKDFSEAKHIMLYLSPGVLCISFSSIISHYFSGLGKQKVLLLANSAGLAVTLSTSYFFISAYGLTGACFTASLAYVVQATVLTVTFMSENKLSFSSLFKFREDLFLLRHKNPS
ncbi:MAG: polysaccharide biosynthesis C-terminal domain-containing protein [bacterium]|nr:polysaccharide biosynthesis C-terminal domain-containing protein [bacterium]